MPGVRYVGGGDMTELTRVALEGLRREQEYLAKQGHKGPLPPAVFLAISGGGDNGAYTAGLLNGWTAAGTRPEFKLVTGISTGALIAPFAFLGPKYDATLKEVYTTISPKDVLVPRSFLGGLPERRDGGQRAAVEADAQVRDRGAAEGDRRGVREGPLPAGRHRRPRCAPRRSSGTWGRSRATARPQALDLFVSIMIASASIPVGFPPTMIDVEVDGKRYQEMHVDGGTMAQVFAYPAVDPRQGTGGGSRGYPRAQALRDPQRQARPGLGAASSAAR